jgi:hypothetical protein
VEAPRRKRRQVAGALAAAALAAALAAGAARALAAIGDPAGEWLRIPAGEAFGPGSVGEAALRNQRALGRMLLVLHPPEGAPAAPLAPDLERALGFLAHSKLEWIVALRGAAWAVLGKPAKTPSIALIETDGSEAVEIPLPATDEEIAAKLRGRLYRRAEADPNARFEARFGALEAVFEPPAGWRFAELGMVKRSLCVLEGPEGRRAYLGVDPDAPEALGECEEQARAVLEAGDYGKGDAARKLSRAHHAGSKSASGAFRATFETAGGEKGAGAFELVKGAGALWAVELGKQASEKEAAALLARFKQSLRKEAKQ